MGEKNGAFNIEFNDDRKKFMSQLIIERLSNGEIPQTLTKPHKIINNLLNKNNVVYQNEKPFKYYCVDIYLNDYNLIIEIMGDYWHCSPVKYNFNDLNDIQKKSIRRDKAKNTYIKNFYNINILYLWESDIIKNPIMCEELINQYIKNCGNLKDYNSFNYQYKNQLLMNSEIIYPYFINIKSVQTAG